MFSEGPTPQDLTPPSDPTEQLWYPEQSRGQYIFPLPNDMKNSLETGRAIAEREPAEPENTLEEVGPFLTCSSPESHTGPQQEAIDFLVPDGTPVLASRDGKVVAIVIENDKWGPSEEFADLLNYIILAHPMGEFSQYSHLAQNSTSLKIGDEVKAGQQIAVVGKTGWTDRDHLHFTIFRGDRGMQTEKQGFIANEFGYKSVTPRFMEKKDTPSKPAWPFLFKKRS